VKRHKNGTSTTALRLQAFHGRGCSGLQMESGTALLFSVQSRYLGNSIGVAGNIHAMTQNRDSQAIKVRKAVLARRFAFGSRVARKKMALMDPQNAKKCTSGDPLFARKPFKFNLLEDVFLRPSPPVCTFANCEMLTAAPEMRLRAVQSCCSPQHLWGSGPWSPGVLCYT
jgi:hypothetical protein